MADAKNASMGKTRQRSSLPNSLVGRPIVSRELFLRWLRFSPPSLQPDLFPFRSPNRRSLTTKLTDIRRTRGSLRFMANCFIIFDIFPVYGCGRAFCLGHCLYCVWWTPLYVPPYALLLGSFARETQPAYRPSNDTRTGLLIRRRFERSPTIYNGSVSDSASNGSTTLHLVWLFSCLFCDFLNFLEFIDTSYDGKKIERRTNAIHILLIITSKISSIHSQK